MISGAQDYFLKRRPLDRRISVHHTFSVLYFNLHIFFVLIFI